MAIVIYLLPFSGVIQQVFIDVNELVAAGNPVVTLSTMGDPEVLVNIPELYISSIKKGQKVKVFFSVFENREFDAIISEIGFNAQNAGTYPVIVKLAKTDEIIRPGLVGSVRFDFKREEGSKGAQDQYPIVPAKAIGEDAKGNFVFLIEESGDMTNVKKHHISVGKLTSEGFEVTEGLSSGQKIAVAGLQTLLDGQKVRLP